MKKNLLFLTALVMLTCSANAQLNLNKVIGKGKEQVDKKKEQVDKKKEQSATQAETQAETQAATQAETEVNQVAAPSNVQQKEDDGGEYDYKKSYKPSAAAIAADPKASDQTIESGYTKSISEIHAAYEQFDPELFPYQPYYKYKEFYYMHDEKDEEIHTSQYITTLMEIAQKPAGLPYYMPYISLPTSDGEVLVTYDEFFKNAWTALFIADPLSTWAFHKYVGVLLFENRMFEIKYEYYMDNPEKGIVNAENGTLLFAPSEAVYTHTQESRKQQALFLARNEVPIDYIRYYLNDLIEKCNAENSALSKYLMYWKIDAIMVNVFTKHKDYKASDVANRKIEASYSVLESQRFDIDTNARLHSAKPVDMPRGVQVDGNTSTKINAMAKEKFEDEFVKTIFLDDNWSEFKEDKYPYRVMHLSLPVAVIIKKGSKYLINYYDITKSPNGGNWNMMVQMGSSFRPVRYQ